MKELAQPDRRTAGWRNPIGVSSKSIIWIGMDMHKDTAMVALYRDLRQEAEVVQQSPNERRKLRRFVEWWSRHGPVRC